MKNESIITKVKNKYYELESDENYKDIYEKKEDCYKRFKEIFSLDKIKTMTLEDYDYPKFRSEEKYKKSLMYFVEHSELGITLTSHQNKLFFWDQNTSTEDEIK